MKRVINVTRVEALNDARLRLSFTDGQSGIADFTEMLAEGGSMVEPLKQDEFFRRVFVQCGVPTWPNGFDVDAMRLHDELSEAGLLTATPETAQEAAE